MHNKHNSSRYFLTESKNPHFAGGAHLADVFAQPEVGEGLAPPAENALISRRGDSRIARRFYITSPEILEIFFKTGRRGRRPLQKRCEHNSKQ